MQRALDAYASKRGFARFLDIPADKLDINAADLSIGHQLHHYVLHPLEYAKNYIEKARDSRLAGEMAAMMSQGREGRRKLERKVRRFLQTMVAVWDEEWMPALMEAQAIARDEHREAEGIGPTLNRLAAEGRLRVPSSFYVYELGRAIAHKDFKPDTAPTAAPWPATKLKDGHAELRPTTAAKDGDWLTWQAHALADALGKMNARLESLGQRTRDIYYIMLAKWVQHRASGREGNPWAAVDEVLELLGYSKKMDTDNRRYGYADRDRWEVRQAIEALGSVWVNMRLKMARNRRQVQVPYRGHFLMLGDRRGQPELGTEARGATVDAFTHIEFDVPALASQGIGPQAAPYLYLHIKALQYDAKHGLEKGIAYWIAEMARINVTDTVRTTPAVLLEQGGKVELDARKPSIVRERLHTALDRLAADGVTDDWKYAAPEWDAQLDAAHDAGKRPRGWANQWLQQSIDIMLPPEFGYQSILTHRQERKHARLKKRSATPKPPPAEAFTLGNADASTLSTQVADAIERRGISKAEAADAIGISRPTLNALLEGRPTRENIRQRASAWAHAVNEGRNDA